MGWVGEATLPFEQARRARLPFFLKAVVRWGHPSFQTGQIGKVALPFKWGGQMRWTFILSGVNGWGYPLFLLNGQTSGVILSFELDGQVMLPFFWTRHTGESALPFNGVDGKWNPSIRTINLRMNVGILPERAKNTMHGLKIHYSYVWGQTLLSMTNKLYNPEKWLIKISQTSKGKMWKFLQDSPKRAKT